VVGVFFALAAAAAIIATVRFFTSDLRATRQLRRMSPSSVADARDGELVKIVGEVELAGDALVSPNRKVECVYYHAWYEELRGGEKGGVGWVHVGEEQDGCSFAIKDESGSALVDATHLVGLLRRDGYETVEFESEHDRGREAVIIVGQRVAVVGRARFESTAGAEALYRDSGKRVMIEGDESSPVVVSDEPSIIGKPS
jgi:hypothetical protein